MHSRRAPRVPTILAIALAFGGAGGCSEESPPKRRDATSPVITLTGEAPPWPDARVTGTLTLRKGCLLIDESIAVFSIGTTWRDPDIVFKDGTVLTLGSRVHMGGGWVGANDMTEAHQAPVPMNEIEACARRTGAVDFVWADNTVEPSGPA